MPSKTPHPTQSPDKWVNPQRRWFDDQIARLEEDAGPISQNTVANFLKLDKSGLARRLDGEIKFKTDELVYLAGLFGQDLGEVTRRAALLRAAWERRKPG